MRNLVSVIVPIYKSKRYLKKCVSTIMNQTYKELEIILVDDGSPDQSGALCDRLAEEDRRIRVIHKENGGASSARNVGIDAATGAYICFVDSDDWMPDDAIEILVNQIQNDESDLCVGVAKNIAIRNLSPQRLPNTCIDIKHIHEVMPYFYALKAPWAKIFRTEIVRDNGLKYVTGIAFGEDTIFVWSYLNCCKRISMVDSEVYCYSLLNPTSVSGKYYRDLADWQYIYIDMIKKTIDHSEISEQKKDRLMRQIIVKEVCYGAMIYSQNLLFDQRGELIERLRYTVNLFRDYLFDDTLELGMGMEKEQKILKSYILQENYDGLADYYMYTLQSSRKNMIGQMIRKIVLICKRMWIYR